MMKFVFRQVVGFLVASPFIVLTYLSAVCVGRERSVEFWGPVLTRYAKGIVKLTVPNIHDASEFDRFASELKTRFQFWKPVYDYSVAYEDRNTLKMSFVNCPFCEALKSVGLSELSPYVCQGDWAVAKDNTDKWTFERQHQIGTGDDFCDHTYKRKQETEVIR
jgi:hypothetical protein